MASLTFCKPTKEEFFLRNRRFVKPRAENEEKGQEDHDHEEQDENDGSDVSATVQAEKLRMKRHQPGNKVFNVSATAQAEKLCAKRHQSEHERVRTEQADSASQESRLRLGAGGAGGEEAAHREQEAPGRARGRSYREALCGDTPQLGHTMVTRSKTRV